MNRISRIVSACAFAVGLAGCAGTQEVTRFPTQPVKIVVPYPAGNATDVVGRIVAEKLSQLWGQPVSIENRSGIPAVDGVAKSKPDGYTLLAHSISYAVDAGLYTNLPYDPEKDIVAVAPFARQPFALVASPTLGAKNVADLVAKAKAGQFKFASLGPTSQLYFIAEQFKKKTGFNASNVTYKSLAEGNGAVAKGDVAFWFPPVAGAVAGVREGKLVALAVTGEKRSAMLPQVPTIAEAGVRDMENSAWFGLWAPAGVPGGIVDKISSDVERALASPDVREKLAKLGAEPMSMTPSQFGRFVRGETASSKRLTAELGIQPQAYSPPAKP